MQHRQLVVGAIIVDSLETPTRLLAARRSTPAELAGMWEFPGGKVEVNESPEAALCREVREELCVELRLGAEVRHASGVWPISSTHCLRLFFARILEGEPVHGESHDMTTWLNATSLDSVAWLPADRAALGKLQAMLGVNSPVTGRSEESW